MQCTLYAPFWFGMLYAASATSTQKNKTVDHSVRDLCTEFQSTLTWFGLLRSVNAARCKLCRSA